VTITSRILGCHQPSLVNEHKWTKEFRSPQNSEPSCEIYRVKCQISGYTHQTSV